ncbi:MAG TPA: hypothetical protein VK608_11855 [Edaphobacter sp.]|nr:hypothetical protein [Edaphobacter sp.]
MRLSAKLFPMAILLAALSPVTTSAQTISSTPCTLNKQVYTCDEASFASTLKQARTIAIEAQPRDQAAAAQLKQLVTSLGKTLAPDTADLTFRLTRTEPSGVYIGPAGAPLAILSVYAQAADGSRGPLLWLETFTGQPDMRWPSIIHATIQQFQENFK